jgi:branched-chain amino acid transport system permease protein
MMTKNLKTAFFSALLVVAVAYPVLGLKLTTVGIKLEVHGASPAVLWTIAAVAVFMFFWQLFRDRLSAAWASAPSAGSSSAWSWSPWPGRSSAAAAPSTSPP